MPNRVRATSEVAAGTLPVALATISALSAETVRQTMAANYSRLLDELVFVRVPQSPDGRTHSPDKKALLSFRRTLEDEEANTVLSMIWKESSYVTVEELAQFSMSKIFSGKCVTAYGLGVAIAEGKSQVAAAITRIRSIALAGSSYGLLERKAGTGNKIPIVCTELLHRFMGRLGDENARACARFFGARSSIQVATLLEVDQP